MQPIGASPVDPSSLEKVTTDVKVIILKCLGVKDLTNIQLVNKLWKTISHKPLVWEQAAKQLNIKLINPKNAEAEVIAYIRFHDIFEEINDYVSQNVNLDIGHCTTDEERFNAVLDYLKSHAIHTFLDFIREIDRFNSKVRQQTAKQMIQRGVLYNDTALYEGLKVALGGDTGKRGQARNANLEIYRLIVDQIKEKSPKSKDLLTEALRKISGKSEKFKPFVEALLKAGAVPGGTALYNSISIGATELVLDYSNDHAREKVINYIKQEIEKVENNNRVDAACESMMIYGFNAWIRYFSEAPPPTYGAKQKKIEELAKSTQHQAKNIETAAPADVKAAISKFEDLAKKPSSTKSTATKETNTVAQSNVQAKLKKFEDLAAKTKKPPPK